MLVAPPICVVMRLVATKYLNHWLNGANLQLLIVMTDYLLVMAKDISFERRYCTVKKV